MTLRQIIYVSCATRECGPEDIADIMAASARNNARDDLTGMLLYCRGTFMQALEGPPQAVDTTLRRIERDARHHSVEVINDGACQGRDFAQWRMGFATLDAPDASLRPEFADVFGAGFAPALLAGRPGKALKLLQQFAHAYRR